jgi:protoporphyrinogen/coproporphyrinogen III oxidase
LDVTIVGGGITGLSAAYELAQRRVPFTLIESAPRLGGLILTERVDGFTIEAGPDSMLVQKPAALQLCDQLGLGPRLISTTPPRTAYILKRGRLYALPSPSILGIPLTWRGVVRYELLPLHSRVRLALETVAPRARDSADESIAAFFRRRFGRATVDLIADPLLGGIHAGSIDKLSMRSLFPRLVEAERRGSVVLGFRRRHSSSATEGPFKSLSSGMSEMVSAIEQRLPAGSVRLATEARALEHEGESWRIISSEAVFTSRAVILCVPAYVAGQLLRSLDTHAAALCEGVPYVSTVSVALAWPRSAVAHDLQGSGFVVARSQNALRITASTWVSSKWSGRAPSGFALIRAFLGSAADPSAVDLADNELIDTARKEVASILGIGGPPVLARVYRWRNAGAQHVVGHLTRVAAIEERLAQYPGLFVAGSGFRSTGIPDCVADGRAAAAAAAATLRSVDDQ